MKTLSKILLIFCLTCLAPVKDAKANIPIADVLQNVMEWLDGLLTSPAKTVLDEGIAKYREISKEASGIKGAVTRATNQSRSFARDYAVKTIYSENVHKPELRADVRRNQIPRYGVGNDTAAYTEIDSKSREILYENLAGLYALSSTTHAKLLQKQKKDNGAAEKKMDNRELIQATTDKKMENADRLTRILLMESSMAGYKTELQVSTLKEVTAEEEEQEEEKPDDEGEEQ